MANKQEDRYITPEDALSLIVVENNLVHTYRNPGTMLLGCHIEIASLKETLQKYASTIQIGGPITREKRHGVVVVDDHGPLFIETDKKSLDAFDPPDKIIITIELDQDVTYPQTEDILRAIVRDAFGVYKTYDPEKVTIQLPPPYTP